MSRRITLLLAAVAAAGLGAAAIATATAAQKPPRKVRVDIVGRELIEPGRYVKVNLRFSPRNFTIRSGSQVTVRERARLREPHTFSLVRRRQLPDTTECRVCGSLFEAHGASDEGPPTTPRVNVGKAGFNRPGDSVVVDVRQTVRFNVTAAKGRNLYYLCAIHPWMQGRIRVR